MEVEIKFAKLEDADIRPFSRFLINRAEETIERDDIWAEFTAWMEERGKDVPERDTLHALPQVDAELQAEI